MKNRTIEELHDKKVGHKKFAKIVDELIERNYKVTNIKEYFEKFKFEVDGYKFEYNKNWKSTAHNMVMYIVNIIDAHKRMNEMWRF